MEINLNCDLGEKSTHYSGINDLKLLKLIDTANIACSYHAGSVLTISKTIINAKKNQVSIGAHPGFNDKKNFGRKKINLTKHELVKLIRDQLEIINQISLFNNYPLTHVKLHGALSNMACENIEISLIIAETIKKFCQDLIFIVLPATKLETASKKIQIKYACEVFVDRNYQDNGLLIPRNKKNAFVLDHIDASRKILNMLQESSIISYTGKKIKCNIDTICIHGDNKNAPLFAKEIKKILSINNYDFVNLDKLQKIN
jgi:UPF0271 protein